jgi:hypothetical protein
LWYTSEGSEWERVEIGRFLSGICKLALDNNGQQLGVALQDGMVYLYKEHGFCKWDLIAMSNAEGIIEQVSEADA